MAAGGGHPIGTPPGSGGVPPDACAVVWAKSWPVVPPHEEWLPLWQHLDDASDAAGLLWDDWVSPSIRALIGESLPEGEADGRRLLCWLAGVHDVGKATPAFAVQVQVGELANRVTRAGLHIGPMVQSGRSALRHEIAGAAIVERWLAEHSGLGTFTRRQLTEVVAAHHGSFPEFSRVQDAPGHAHLMGDGAWTAVQDELVARAATRAQVMDRWPVWTELELPQTVQMILAGLVVMADWIASGDAFPLLPVDVVPQVLQDSAVPAQRARRAWQEVDLGHRWSPRPVPVDPAERFVDRFSGLASPPRPVQLVATERAASMTAPGLMIIEAPMGEGKTEAGFMAAEVLAARTGATGCFVALPTQATSNAMFHRMLDWLKRLPDHDEVGTQTVALVHGKAALNEEYRGLTFVRGGTARVYDDEATDRAGGDASAGAERLWPAVSDWMRGRKKAALSSFVVGTIDQVLFGALRARHLMLRQLSLVSKVVIIDEVHAADVYMSTFLDRALEWLGAAGAPVILMSATLPARRRVELYLAYERGRRLRLGQPPDDDDRIDLVEQRLSGDIGYPVLVTSGASAPRVDVLPTTTEPVPVTLHRLADEPERLVALLTDRLREGGCAVVVRNTVRRAQQTAALLAEEFGEDLVTLAHAQFVAVDRVANDAALLARFGPPGDGVVRPEKSIVVATQVVEQSLDLDFDLMVTDIAPVDLVLQRIGRLHRHRRGPGQANRPKPLRAASCYVTGVDWAAVPPAPDRGAVAVYGHWPLVRGLAALADHLDGPPVLLPGAIATLVQEAYADEAHLPAGWEAVAARARASYAEARAVRHQRALDFALPQVGVHGRDLYDLARGSVGAIDEDSREGQACVRDGDMSIEVVVVQRGADGSDRILDWVSGTEALPLRHVDVSPRQARVLAGCTLRLPWVFTLPAVIDQVIRELERDRFDGWQRAPLLAGQLALVLDDDASATLAGFHLHYDTRRGLVVEALAGTTRGQCR